MTKAYLIFFTVFLSFIMLAIPVYSEASEQQPLEQQGHEVVQEVEQIQEEIQEDTQEDEQEKPTQVVSSEEGIYNLTFLANANMRSEPTTDSKSVIIIPFGVDLASDQKITTTKGEIWYAVTYSGMGGYVSSDVADVETIYINNEDEEAEAQEGVEVSIQELPKENTSVNTFENSSSESQTTTQSAETTVSDASNMAGSDLTKTSEIKYDANEPSVIRKVDFIFVVFLLVAIVGIVLSFIVFGRLRHEYVRYRKQILKNRKDKVLQD